MSLARPGRNRSSANFKIGRIAAFQIAQSEMAWRARKSSSRGLENLRSTLREFLLENPLQPISNSPGWNRRIPDRERSRRAELKETRKTMPLC